MEQRQNIAPICADPDTGLTQEQVRARLEAGLVSGKPHHSGKTPGEIIWGHCFTFFNLVFLVLEIGRASCRERV